MKDNRGFSLFTMLIFCCFCGICMFISYLSWQKFLRIINDGAVRVNEKGQYAERQNKMINDYRALGMVTLETPYHDLEVSLKNSAQKYVEQVPIESEYQVVLTLSHLRKQGVIDEFSDSNGKCQGYVIYSPKKKIYIPYIRCFNYETNGYNRSLES